MTNCNSKLQALGQPYPRTCRECGLGPCKYDNPQGANKVKNVSKTWDEQTPFEFTYINHEGKKGHRVVVPISIRFGKNPWYPTERWLMLAWDMEKQDLREFDMEYILPTVTR